MAAAGCSQGIRGGQDVDSESAVREKRANHAPAARGGGPLDGVRPRLQRDVLFGDTGEGVFIHNAEKGFILRGRSAYRWMSALFRHFDGETTVGELCEGLTDDRRELITNLVRTLLDRGFMRDAAPSATSDLPAAVRERFSAQLNYIDHYVDGAEERFARFRGTRVLVAGTDQIAHGAVAGLVRNGLERIDLVGECEGLPALAAETEALTAAHCPGSVSSARHCPTWTGSR